MKFAKYFVIALAVFTFILTIVFFTWWSLKDPIMFGNEKFTQIKWMQYASEADQECKRGDMAYDLQQNILIKGAQKEAVMALLGRPSLEHENMIEYDLGRCMLVYHGLLLYFDDQDKLLYSRISSH